MSEISGKISNEVDRKIIDALKTEIQQSESMGEIITATVLDACKGSDSALDWIKNSGRHWITAYVEVMEEK